MEIPFPVLQGVGNLLPTMSARYRSSLAVFTLPRLGAGQIRCLYANFKCRRAGGNGYGVRGCSQHFCAEKIKTSPCLFTVKRKRFDKGQNA